jgi:hypothetical protein
VPDAGHKDLTSKDSSLLRKARHSKAGQPQEGIHFKVLLTMRQTFHYLQVLIKGMAQNWLLERQRTAEDLSGVLSITTADNFVYTLVNGYLLNTPEHTICQLLTRTQ